MMNLKHAYKKQKKNEENQIFLNHILCVYAEHLGWGFSHSLPLSLEFEDDERFSWSSGSWLREEVPKAK